eukprot:11330657-Karenia_brevis.AAC.1
MDVGQSWTHQWADHGLDDTPGSVICFSDGGCRWGQCAGAAWAIVVGSCSNKLWSYTLVRAGGRYFAEPVSSFVTEAVALEEAAKTA